MKWPHHERCLGRILWLSEDEKSADEQDDADDAGHRYDPRLLCVQSSQPLSQDDAESDQAHDWGEEERWSERWSLDSVLDRQVQRLDRHENWKKESEAE